ncbi:MAG: hypothetical protein ICV66_14155, partial [Chitinophagaceae bacterium]|nr:hypothetical protein [Chitinophagaceae bacterium]
FERGVNVMEAFNLLSDPQTNGGMLVAVGEDGLDEIKNVFEKNDLEHFTQPIGIFKKRTEKIVIVKK